MKPPNKPAPRERRDCATIPVNHQSRSVTEQRRCGKQLDATIAKKAKELAEYTKANAIG